MKGNYSVIKSGLSMIWKWNPIAVLLTVCLEMMLLINFYTPVFLSAYVINALQAGVLFGSMIENVLIYLLIILIMGILIGVLRQYLANQYHTSRMRGYKEFSLKSLNMDYSQMDSQLVNELKSKLFNDERMGAGIVEIYTTFSQICQTILNCIAAIVILLPLFLRERWNSPITILFAGLFILLTIGEAVFNSKVIQKRRYKLMDEDSKLNNFFTYFVNGGHLSYKNGKDIRIYGAYKLIREKIMNENSAFKAVEKRISRVEGTGAAVRNLKQGLIQGAAYLYVVIRAVSGDITTGDLIKYAGTILAFSTALSTSLISFTKFAAMCYRMKSRMDYMRIPNVMDTGSISVKRGEDDYVIEFKNVSFRYPSSDTYVLQNVSLKINVGKKMAIVGMNGSGKTTLIKLLCRFYEPTEGVITLNDIDIRKYDFKEYMDIFSVVFQDFNLFSLMLGQNVAAGMDYDQARVLECLKKAGIEERYQCMEQGCQTYLYKDFYTDGVEVSGGEAQKIAIARAIYKDAPIVILDEPTAALDPIAEHEIYTRFDEIAMNKTTIYISHRLSSCKFCDDISVFDKGRLVQRGKHEKLLADSAGLYKKMWESQAQYYN